MEHDKQIRAAEDAQRVTAKAMQDALSYMTVEERQAAERTRLYMTLKARDALDIYYQLYPEERPKGEQATAERARDDEGRDR